VSLDSAESPLDQRLAEVLARRIEDFERLESLERLSGGASQETHRVVIRAGGVERRFAWRRAPGGQTAARMGGISLATEAQLMESARGLGVPEPEVVLVFDAEDGVGAGFLMEWLDGETLGARIVKSPDLEAVRPSLARRCGEILAQIHATDLEATGLGERLTVADPAELVEQSWALYRGYDTPQPMIDYTARWLLDHLPDAPRTGLVHGDFRNGNLMIGPRGVVAVLDWELAHVGDPMRDLGWLCTNSWRFGRAQHPVGGFGSREELFAGYESVSGTAVEPEHVRFWEVFGSFWWAVGCLTMAHHYRSGPDQSVERAAIGRRSSECQVDCVNLLIPGPVDVIEPPALRSNLDMPRADELVTGVRDLLRNDVMGATEGRLSFMARVAGNGLDVVLRELAVGPEHHARERARLVSLVGRDDDLESLRWALVEGLRDGHLALDTPGLADHLRATVVNQVAIDQPRYSGYRAAAGLGD